jgi:tetratricopeptide (TPR) repeat protein
LRLAFFLVSVIISPVQLLEDPASGVMWTGEFIDPPSPYADYATAQGICSLLSVGGYTGWRLPSLDEFSTAVGPAFVYRVLDPANRIDRPSGVKKLDYNSPSPSSELEFNHFSLSPLWTSTSAGQGRVYLKKWTPPGSSVAVEMTLRGRDAGYAGVFCVRQMEPELLQLAKDAHPPTPVTGVPQLKSIALLVQAEDALDADDFAGGISDAKQALTLDPKSIRALHDIGIANAYSGNWAEALSNLETAHTLDKSLAETNTDLKWVKTFQKQAATDPNAMQAWVLVHDADVAQSDKSFEDAITAANRVISLEPSWPEGYDRLGLALGGLERWPEAIAALSKSVSLDQHHETNAKQDLKIAKQMQKKKSR